MLSQHTHAYSQGPKPKASGLLGTGPQPASAGISIQPPSTGDDYDSEDGEGEDDESHPLSHAELRAKILHGASKPRDASTLKSKSKTNESTRSRGAARQ